MAYHYEITIGNFTYIPNGLIDSSAKVVWDKGDAGLNYRKRLDGSFTLYRSNNEALYDMIMSFTHCTQGFIWVLDKDWTNPPVVMGAFNKRDIEYNVDKCNMVIKPRYYDPYGIDALIQKDYNIINDDLDIYSVSYAENYQFEFLTAQTSGVDFGGLLTYDDPTNKWLDGDIPPIKAFGGGSYPGNTLPQGWTFYSQDNLFVGFDPTVLQIFDVTTVWFREVKLTSYAADKAHATPPPSGTGSDFEFLEVVQLNGVSYNKWIRTVSGLVGELYYSDEFNIRWRLTDYFGNSEIRTITRARKLNAILEHFADEFGCVLSSQFFYNNVNPVSLYDLTNLMIAQKSDCKFDAGVEPTDPATLGIITFKSLMEQLWAMFQVTWVIADGILYIEHINYFRNNFSYITNTTVGLDLTAVSPVSLAGSVSYLYDQNIPIRIKFNFMEQWNIDFVGTDIDYSNCLQEGNTETVAADLITTDLDPTYLDSVASNDGFCLFHCNEILVVIVDGVPVYRYEVISQVGEISRISVQNGHLSWANLHLYYWTLNSPLATGMFNGYDVNFLPPLQRLRKQRPIEFPFCVENFDDVVNNLIRTTMGDGEIVKAEYDFKSGNIKIELSYE